MDYARRQRDPFANLPQIALVAVLHVVLIYALVNGLAKRVIEVMKAPIETKIIQEVKKPLPEPPPPPPPKLETPPPPFIPPPEIQIQVPVQQAPVIQTVTTTPPPPSPPQVVAPPAPPAPPRIRRDYKAAYRVDPQFPRVAVDRGISGRVLAWVHVSPAGYVTSVEIRRSTSSIFNKEVIRALSQWRFNPEPTGFIGEYDIVFNLKD